MTNPRNITNSNRQKWITGVYTAVVITVFALLMQALFATNQPPHKTHQSEAKVSQSEIEAIVKELNSGNDAATLKIRPENEAEPLRENETASDNIAWTSHASSWTKTNRPVVAIIIDDLGLDEAATNTLAAMHAPLTLAYLPYADNLDTQTRLIRSAGHELMVHLPMQSHRSTADPGDNALLSGLSFDEFAQRLEWNLARFDGYVGVNNHMGSSLTEDPGLMVRVMARLKSSGLLFVDSLTTPDSVGARAANAVNVPYVKRDVFLDNERDEKYIRNQIETLERIAHLRGYAVGIGHPYPETLKVLKEWQKSLDFKKITLVPISQIVSIATERRAKKQ